MKKILDKIKKILLYITQGNFMTEKCDCEACTVREKYQDKQKIVKNTDKISGFKENIA